MLKHAKLQQGPKKIVNVNYICKECEFLKTEYWVEYPDGERDSGTNADCHAFTPPKNISPYYNTSRMTPDWCPYIERVRDV